MKIFLLDKERVTSIPGKSKVAAEAVADEIGGTTIRVRKGTGRAFLELHALKLDDMFPQFQES
jgi:hypothetical protein